VHIKSASLSADVHPLSPEDPPRIQFTSDGHFGASDGINYLSGTYTQTATGFQPDGDTASTAVGYAGSDPLQLAIQKAVGDMTDNRETTVVVITEANGGSPVIATMTVDDFVLTFQRGAVVHPEPPPSGTEGPETTVAVGTPPNCDLSVAPGNVPCPGDPS